MGKYWLLWQLVCDQLVCVVVDYTMKSIPIPNMAKIDTLILVGKEITHCYGKITVAMTPSMRPTGVHGCRLHTSTNAYSKYVKIDNLIMVAMKITGCYGEILVAMVSTV